MPDWVETVAGVFEYVYDIEINKMGYKAPPGIRYDIYLADLVAESVYGYTQNDNIGVTATSYPSYIIIDRSFTSRLYVDQPGGPYDAKTSLRITAAHEFHHAIQFAYNAYFNMIFAEMTSTWMEDEVYDSGNQLYTYIDDYLPDASSIPLNAQAVGNSKYGRWVFNRYIAETQGSRTAIRSVWKEIGDQPVPAGATSVNDGIDVPLVPVLDTVLKGNLGNNFFGFAKRMLLQNWLSHVGDIARIPTIAPAQTFTGSGSIQAPSFNLPSGYTFAVYKYQPSLPSGSLQINFATLPASIAVAAEKVNSLGVTEYPYNASSQSVTVPSFEAGDVVYLVICNNSNGDMGSPVVVTPAFPVDESLVSDGVTLSTDGLALDANRLTVPVQQSSSTSGGGSSGGGCFIATAAYGSYLHPKVAELRQFRDRHLLTNAPGRLFVSLYYRLSPPIAEIIAEHEWMKGGVRVMLVPVVLSVEHPAGALMTVLLLMGGAGIARRRKLALVRVRR
nr:MXAN_6640 family putative metalloprotease [Citrifermentans bremense]